LIQSLFANTRNRDRGLSPGQPDMACTALNVTGPVSSEPSRTIRRLGIIATTTVRALEIAEDDLAAQMSPAAQKRNERRFLRSFPLLKTDD
jgi:hypothetical protein